MSHPKHSFTAIPGVEASVTAVLLPRCASCGHKHPKAYMPALRQDDCPECGAPSASPGEPVVAEAHLNIGGWWGLAVKTLLHAGRWLRDLSKRI